MLWAGIALGGFGFVLSHRFRETLDPLLSARFGAALRRVRRWLEPAPAPDEDLVLTGRLISSLQAGISLDASLEAAHAESPPRSPLRARLRSLLDGGSPGNDFLSAFLRTALDTGMPALSSLQNMERALRTRRKLALKAVSVSANCRAQAEVLSWLPWVMAGAIALVDSGWFLGATQSAVSWFLWALAILLAGLGRSWIKHSVARALRARGAEEQLEEELLPDFVLRVIAGVSQGIDVETAGERALSAAASPALSRAFAGDGGARMLRLRSTLRHACRTGAPVREELGAFLHDLQADLEARWEERVQRLPIALLGPLFLCFFPSSLLVLAGLLVPVFQAAL